jgi:acetyl/propionyl-CoA carboxylase alpha subunit/acetyl-CoA carboxylase carboxyltransferase component
MVRALRELSSASGVQFRTTAVIEADQVGSWLQREADEAIVLPAGTSTTDVKAVGAILSTRTIDALGVSYDGGVPWRAWAREAESHGWTFIGPSAETLDRLLDPIEIRRIADAAGIATVPWCNCEVQNVDDARGHAERLGYPVVCRSSGSSLFGIGVAREPSELEAAVRQAQSVARRSGSPVIVERFLPGVRRLEVPVLSVPDGHSWALDVMDASLRRRDGSVMIEAPAAALGTEVAERLKRHAEDLARAAGHRNLGTMVFLFEPKHGDVTFLGYEPGCGGEYAAAEILRGMDLTKTQIQVALGSEALSPPPEPRGSAVVSHVKAHRDEPGAMEVERFEPAGGAGIRADAAAATGDRLASGASVAELVAWGANRQEALQRMKRGLSETSLLIRSGESSVPVLTRILEESDPWLGPVDADWLSSRLRAGGFWARSRAAIALFEAAIEAYELEQAVARQAFHTSAKRGRPEAKPGSPRTVELELDGHAYELRVAALGADRYAVRSDAGTTLVGIEHRREGEHRLVVGTGRYRVVTARTGFVHRIEIDGEPHRVHRDKSGWVRSNMPAVVASLAVKEGDMVRAGDRIAVLEAMKTEMNLYAPFAGRVQRIMARANIQVAPGEPILLIEPESRHRSPASGAGPLDLSAWAVPSSSLSPVAVFEQLMLGYDVDPAEFKSALKAYGDRRDAPPSDFAREARVLQTFRSLVELGPMSDDAEDAEDGGLRLSRKEALRSYLMDLSTEARGLPSSFRQRLMAVLAPYGVDQLTVNTSLLEALHRVFMALQRRSELAAAVVAILGHHAESKSVDSDSVEYRTLLDRIIVGTQAVLPGVSDTARAARYRIFDGPLLEGIRQEHMAQVDAAVEVLTKEPSEEAMGTIVGGPQSMSNRVLRGSYVTDPIRRPIMLEALTRRYYRRRSVQDIRVTIVDDEPIAHSLVSDRDGVGKETVLGWLGVRDRISALGPAFRSQIGDAKRVAIDLYVRRENDRFDPAALEADIQQLDLPPVVHRVAAVIGPGPRDPERRGTAPCVTLTRQDGVLRLDDRLLDFHPMVAERLEFERLQDFELTRLDTPEDIHMFSGVGRDQPLDRRIFVYAEVRDFTAVHNAEGRVVAIPQVERVVAEALACLRRVRLGQGERERTDGNRLDLFVWPVISVPRNQLVGIARKLAPATTGLGLEQVRVSARMRGPDGEIERKVLVLSNPSGLGVELRLQDPDRTPTPVRTPYQIKVMKLRLRGLMHPHELIRNLTPDKANATQDLPAGEFIEHDFNEEGKLVPIERGPGENKSNIIVGLIRTFTAKHPEGMTRVALLGDPSRAMGSLAEPECRRIMAGLDLAEQMGIPTEWYAVSAGAEISKDRGTENMDWIAAVLRHIIDYTQAGHELNIVVCGINVGAQPYWNAEATMLMHTQGILVMCPGTAMVLTGKQALDYSGGVSAEDNLGIGGYERVMGPNGQAQYYAEDLVSAGKLLLRHYEHTYRAPGERYPRTRPTEDPRDRDVSSSPHGPCEGSNFETVGDVFSDVTNPGRKRPFDIRRVMRSVVDVDSQPLERWRDMRDAETVVTWDAHVGGHPVALLGIESRPIRRLGFVPADGPSMWTAGTLFPQSSKKAARAINAASRNRPIVILANLTGFDGSPESLRMVQLEFGAEIGRAVVNFDGPIVFCVVSRFHGGAFVVFSNRLNDRMESIALEGTYASVIGGAPAAAVVFARELRKRVDEDPRVVEATEKLKSATGAEKAWLTVQLQEVRGAVHSEQLGRLATEYDGIHNIERARDVRSVHRIIPPSRLRLDIIESLERGKAVDGGT